MRTLIAASLLVVSVPGAGFAQSLMEASVAARKARAESSLEWIAPRTTEATVAATTPATETSGTIPATTAVVDASPAGPTDALTKNRAAGVALLGARLVAVRELLATRTLATTRYRDACAGKSTSAGWLLRGEEVTTPNAQTPACRAIAADIQTQTVSYDRERAAIAETARTAGILPGVLRDLISSHALPD